MRSEGSMLLIKHAAEIVTSTGTTARKGTDMNRLERIIDGALLAKDGIVEWVGKTAELPEISRENLTIIDASGCSVIPGFVDSHTHFVFGGYRPEEFFWRLSGTPYLEILERGGGILNTVKATQSMDYDAMFESASRRLDDMLLMGVTTVEGKSGYGLDFDTELMQLKVMGKLNAVHTVEVVPTFMGAHAIPPKYHGRGDDYVTFIVEELLPAVVEQSIAEFCDVFCEKGVFSVDQTRKILQAAGDLGLKRKIHADEIVSFGGAELAAELGAVSADHLLQASDKGIADMAARDVVATVLPITAFCLKEKYARARWIIDNGGALALATDYNPGSCFSHSIPMLIALAAIQLTLSPAEILTALTLNGAAAVGRADRIGTLEPGKQADILILKYPSYLFLSYHAGMNIVDRVIKKGQVVVDKGYSNLGGIK
ncbi:imidazolonepropionase [Pelosinus propionicus]|uniref:Imidazolonepropionase n=1 Tax=Pelosinus propionicus DSM 13327 TaxID=1123291 RepID=A0A1I4IU00_9FIRM|nr:imidazolonepropionase [Pelosinus propionicus]SFL57246.1 imidazolonepropionase [Pelosinus propionicus DSM 13327]